MPDPRMSYPPRSSDERVTTFIATHAVNPIGSLTDDFRQALLGYLELQEAGQGLEDLWKQYIIASGLALSTQGMHVGQHENHYLPPDEAQPQIQITHLAAWIEASYTTEFDLGQSGLSAAGSTGFEYDVGNPPWFATPPILNDLVAPPWSDNPPGPDNPLLPPDVWFPTLYIPAGIASGDFEGRTAHILYLVSEEPDSVSAVVTGDIGATLVGVTSLGAGSWFGRSGYGVLVEFMYDTANDLPEITDFAITVTVEATVGASTLNSVSNILHKYVTF